MIKSSVILSKDKDSLIILDQTLLPAEEKYLYLKTKEKIWEAIKNLRVRGAPAIGIAAAYGIYVITKNIDENFDEYFRSIKGYLSTARPTAVNLFWALERMEECLNRNTDKDLFQRKELLRLEADKIRDEDEKACFEIGINGLTLLSPRMTLLTHCNAGSLATARYGTALAPIYLGQEKGYDFKVFSDETRPLLQGARLTTWELMQRSIDVTLLCDNAAASLMKKGKIDAVIVGCDRVAMNGDVANKIGTASVAVIAKEYSVPFYVCCPLSTIDTKIRSGDEIEIEERNGEEIYKMWFKKQMAPDNVKTYNPAFDVTDNKYVTALITEKGIIHPPYCENVSKIMNL